MDNLHGANSTSEHHFVHKRAIFTYYQHIRSIYTNLFICVSVSDQRPPTPPAPGQTPTTFPGKTHLDCTGASAQARPTLPTGGGVGWGGGKGVDGWEFMAPPPVYDSFCRPHTSLQRRHASFACPPTETRQKYDALARRAHTTLLPCFSSRDRACPSPIALSSQSTTPANTARLSTSTIQHTYIVLYIPTNTATAAATGASSLERPRTPTTHKQS